MLALAMSDVDVVVQRIDAAEAERRLPELARILVECVDDGGGVSFLAPMAMARAEQFWRGVVDGLRVDDRIVLVAIDSATQQTLGTVQVALAWVRDRPGVTSPIVGARTAAQLRVALSVEDLTLPPEIVAALDDVSAD